VTDSDWDSVTLRLTVTFEAEQNSVRKERWATSYRDLTGEDVESRLSILND
jgi:hypothetical protein